MRLNHFEMYPERAFMKVAGRMTLEGGSAASGGSGKSNVNSITPNYQNKQKGGFGNPIMPTTGGQYTSPMATAKPVANQQPYAPDLGMQFRPINGGPGAPNPFGGATKPDFSQQPYAPDLSTPFPWAGGNASQVMRPNIGIGQGVAVGQTSGNPIGVPAGANANYRPQVQMIDEGYGNGVGYNGMPLFNRNIQQPTMPQTNPLTNSFPTIQSLSQIPNSFAKKRRF